MPEIDFTSQHDDSAVRKWGEKLLFVQPLTSLPPAVFFDAVDHKPILPTDARVLGFITTDGVDQEDSVSSENTQMDQQLEPVRRDLTGIEKSLSTTFGEDNAWVQCLIHGVPLEDWPDQKDGPWAFHDGAVSDYPYMRIGVIAVDGVGSQARYRYEYGYRAALTAKGARKLARNAVESYQATFGLFRDKAAGKSYSRLQNGPWYFQDAQAAATIEAGAITAITVTEGGSGYVTPPTVVISGDGTGATATAVLTNGKVTSVTVDAGGTGYTTATVSFTR